MEFPCPAVGDLHHGQTQSAEDIEVGTGVAPHLRHTSEQEDRHVDAALQERARHYKAVAAVVAATTKNSDVPLDKILVNRLDGGDDLPSGVLHQDERRNPDVFDGPTIG